MTLRRLAVDMDAFFPSVEQQDDPALRGRPVAVVPLMTRSTSCIAASHEAKRCGIRTGTPVWDALRRCPKLVLVEARPARYVAVHHQIVDAVERFLPGGQILSVDEMVCPLRGDDRQPHRATALAYRIKDAIRAAAGESLTCSVGVAPNGLLAKVATDIQKPDGVTVLLKDDLPGALHTLALSDFPGIGPRMERRLRAFGVVRVDQLCQMSVRGLSAVWESRVHGERWYHLLRGEDVPPARTVRRTVGHSHVLPPDLRTDAGARAVLVRLIHKAAARLRAMNYWCGAFEVGVRYDGGLGWGGRCRVSRCQDTPSLLRAFDAIWAGHRPGGEPRKVSTVLTDLVPAASATPSLFPDDRAATALSHAMDDVNGEFGRSTVYFGTMQGMEDTAPTRVSFTRVPEFDRRFD